jgi:hypothetical protein
MDLNRRRHPVAWQTALADYCGRSVLRKCTTKERMLFRVAGEGGGVRRLCEDVASVLAKL